MGENECSEETKCFCKKDAPESEDPPDEGPGDVPDEVPDEKPGDGPGDEIVPCTVDGCDETACVGGTCASCNVGELSEDKNSCDVNKFPIIPVAIAGGAVLLLCFIVICCCMRGKGGDQGQSMEESGFLESQGGTMMSGSQNMTYGSLSASQMSASYAPSQSASVVASRDVKKSYKGKGAKGAKGTPALARSHGSLSKAAPSMMPSQSAYTIAPSAAMAGSSRLSAAPSMSMAGSSRLSAAGSSRLSAAPSRSSNKSRSSSASRASNRTSKGSRKGGSKGAKGASKGAKGASKGASAKRASKATMG